MIPSIDQLEQELIAQVRELDAFRHSGFSIYSLDDLEAKAAGQGADFPLVGVGYNGCEPVSGGAGGQSESSHVAKLVTMQFIVAIGIQYRYTGQDDTKPQAKDLLDQVRRKLQGFKGLNARPWIFVGERPEPEASGDGVAFYASVWQTVLAAVGTFNQT